MGKTIKKILAFVITAVLLIGLLLLAVNIGPYKVTMTELFKGLFIEPNDKVQAIFDLRFPRIFIAMVGGAALAVSGVLLQAVMKNPLAEPGIIGISSGASFTAMVAMMISPALYYYIPFIACIGGMIAFAVVYSLAWKGGLSPLRIILVGVAVNTTITGVMGIFSKSGGAIDQAVSMVNSFFNTKVWKDFNTLCIYVIIGFIACFFVLGKCNILSLEDKTARSLGINVSRTRIIVSVISVLLASVSTAIVGPISFLGLIVPHIARIFVGSNHKVLVPYSMLLGAFTLLLADTVGRTIVSPNEISASVIMAVVGGPFFILLLRGARKSYGQ